ncbi:MAG: adenosylmethionine--8-amino-7-oxononanoate transaminase, partial [Thiobacillus sp.]|nr:adenosylmethionine--8-amino-7-oxononanoate transaminase [Thiobacillus sp.]
AISSWWVNLFGHCNPRINAAITDQLGKIEHVMLAGATHAPVVELSERLAKLTGLGHAFYGSDGSSATEIALKMSAHFWRNSGQAEKNGFVSLKNGYHGETVGALSVTDIPLFKRTYAPLLRHSAQVPTPDARLAQAGESAEAFALRCANVLETYLAEHAATTAAFILEPLVQGAAGMAMYHPVYLKRARELCDRHQVHLIADEIAVGFGRTGTFFACEQAAIRPDFICLSKGITGGYLPLSAVLTTDEIYTAFYGDATAKGFLHSHSYTGNPLACRAALAVLDIFESDQVIAANQNKALEFARALAQVADHPRARNFRQCGMIWAFEVADARPDFAARFHQVALAQGVFIRPIGQTVYVMPPYVSELADMTMLAQVMLHGLEQTEHGAS